MESALKIAEEYGLPVFPCRPRDEGEYSAKSPYTEHGFLDAAANVSQISEWWAAHPDALVGVPTGKRTKLLVIDVDPKGLEWYRDNANRLACGLVHKTKRQGYHLLYQMPDADIRNSTGKIAPGIDVRGEGGYIIWWPAEGLEAVGGLEEISQPPDWLVTSLLGRRKGNGEIPSLGNGGKFPEGTRNDSLAREAGRLRRIGLSQDAMAEALWVVNNERCDPPLSRDEVRAIASSIARYEPSAPNGVPLPGPPRQIRTLAAIATSTAYKKPLIPDLLYAGAWLLVGRPKIGKSWLELQLALAMGSGRKFMDWEIEKPCGVLYIAAEDDEARMKSRLDTQLRFSAPSTVDVILREDIKAIATECGENQTLYEWLDAYLGTHGDTRLVILDTEMAILQTWHGESEGRNTNSAIESDYMRTSAFDAVGQRRNAAIMLANHAAKRKGGQEGTIDFHELINRTNTAFAGVTGSMVLADLPDADLHDPKQKERVLAVRCRDLAEDQIWTVKQQSDAMFEKLGPYTEVRQTEAEKEIMECLQSLMDGLGEGKFVASAEIAETLGKQRQTIKRAVTRMISAGRTVWNGFKVSAKPGSKGGYRLDKL